MNRKRINQFARGREDKMEKRLKQIGFELVEDTARRTINKGDKVMRHTDTGLLIVADSKSTQATKSIKLMREALEKIVTDAANVDRKALGMIIFSFKGDTEMYAAINLRDLEGVMY